MPHVGFINQLKRILRPAETGSGIISQTYNSESTEKVHSTAYLFLRLSIKEIKPFKLLNTKMD